MEVYMKIKRYMGKDTQEALLKVKMDLGNDAIILNTKKVRQKGIKKYFTKPLIEVMAAIDDQNAKPKERELTKIEPNHQQYEVSKNKMSQKEEKVVDLENKVNNIEKILDRILSIVDNEYGKDGSLKLGTGNNNDQKGNKLPQVFQLLYNNLLKNEVDEDIAKTIIEQVAKRGNSNDINDATLVMQSVIASMFGEVQPLSFRMDGKPTVILFVGPTGVGKTTTLAKLAASFILNNNKKVAFITADTYRIAAVEQLKTYAEILGVPISVAYSVSDITDEIEKYSDKDIILIDTAGCSYRDKQKFDELKRLVEACKADNTFLVLSSTVSSKNCKEIIKNYDFIPDYKLIFTKLDEAPVYGNILNTKCYSQKCLSYVTNGQNVPDDIEIASVDKLSRNLLGHLS